MLSLNSEGCSYSLYWRFDFGDIWGFFIRKAAQNRCFQHTFSERLFVSHSFNGLTIGI